ncbi:MAG TPA: hypothetical protein DIC59_05705 [Candidatus Competibacteraceae bacterium]|nr:hypothetical protein [Candidatus Competibacteraceae bacterium]
MGSSAYSARNAPSSGADGRPDARARQIPELVGPLALEKAPGAETRDPPREQERRQDEDERQLRERPRPSRPEASPSRPQARFERRQGQRAERVGDQQPPNRLKRPKREAEKRDGGQLEGGQPHAEVSEVVVGVGPAGEEHEADRHRRPGESTDNRAGDLIGGV